MCISGVAIVPLGAVRAFPVAVQQVPRGTALRAELSKGEGSSESQTSHSSASPLHFFTTPLLFSFSKRKNASFQPQKRLASTLGKEAFLLH